MSTLTDVLHGLWLGLSVLAIVAGSALAVVMPNGFPGVLLALTGAAFFLGFLERERA